MNNRDPVMGGNALNRGEKRLTGNLEWFDRSARHYAPQIENALRFGCLDRLFQV